MTTKILGNQITSYTIDTVQLSNTATAAFAKTLAPKVLYANVASNTFTVLDDTAVNVGGGYIVVTGAEFQSGATVLIDTVPASAVTYVNSTTLQVQVPTKSAASYNLYVVNPDGGVGIKVSGITYSSEPSWTTASPLANQEANTAFGVNLSATGASSYSVAAGSTLPTGTTLAANGYFSGTVSIGAQTTYSFSIVATDDELQDSTKTFQVTVTLTPLTRLYSWGMNSFGVGGLNTSGGHTSSPTQIGTGTTWKSVSSRATNSAAIRNDGTLWTWGYNTDGQLGHNDTVYARSSPTQVGTATTWNLVSVGGYSIMATKTDGTLWSWGDGTQGQLGLGNTIKRSSPVQVGTGTDWNRIDTSSASSIATKTNGTLWAWGQGYMGKLGLGDTVDRSSPVQVGADTTWNRISISTSQCLAIKTDGTLWAWGRNDNHGSLGLNEISTYRKLSPTQVGTSTNWNLVSGGEYSSMATKTDGTLWTWGQNNIGQLGLNNISNRSSPTQVGTETNWNLISASATSSQNRAATKTDGTLWTWGDNGQGKLGQNNQTNRSSPVQVGASTTWSFISAGRGVFAITSIAP